MLLPDINKYHFLFLATIAVLLAFKWHDLHLPYFWDELGVYTQAIDYQWHHGISLMPASVPPVFSRGHPLFFTAINAFVWHIFGERIFVGHLFCFFISVLLLLSIYIKVSKYFSPLTGLLSVILLAIQPLFLAQSAFVLPEISLSLFAFLALCAFYENKLWLYILFASLAILTKESAIVLPVVALSYTICQWIYIRSSRPLGQSLISMVLIVAPYLIYGGFLLIQKHQNGWYFFPYHIESVSFDLHSFTLQSKHYLTFIFRSQGRSILTFIFIVGTIIAALLGRWPDRSSRGFLPLLALSCIAFIAINSLFGVYMDRYVTIALVFICIGAAASLTAISSDRWFVSIILIICFIIIRKHNDEGIFNYDADLAYRRDVHVLQDAMIYAESNALIHQKIYVNFPAYFALTFPAGGYLRGEGVDEHQLSTDIKDDNIHLLILCEPGADLSIDHSLYDLSIIKQFDDGYAHVAIYHINKK